jgi:tetratricopeptide (TPR) repeat protein
MAGRVGFSNFKLPKKKNTNIPMRTIILTMTAVLCIAFTAGAQADSATAYLQKGLEEKTKGRTLEAWKRFDKAYGFNKNDRQVVGELAKSLFDLRRYPQSREKYLELEKLGDNSAATYQQLMTLSFNLRQFPDAVKYANLYKKADPAAKVSYYIGKANYDQENYGEAIKHLTAAATEEPQNAEVPYLVARAYVDMSNYKLAMPFFEKALALQPTNSRWMYEMGLIYYAMHEDKQSLKYFQMAIDNGIKQDNEFLQNLSVAYLNNNMNEKAIEILKGALERRPADQAIINMLAEAHYDTKKYDEAIGYWDKLLEMDNKNAKALFMIGMSYQKKGDKSKGQALCDKAIQMDPSLAKNRQKMEMPGGL